MNVPNEILMAYVDRELAPAEMARIEAEIAARPELRAYVEQQRALRASLRDAFDGILDAPLPERLLAAVSTPPSRRWRLTQAVTALSSRAALWASVPAAVAVSCAVLVGLLIATPNRSDIVNGRGGLSARGALAAALTSQLAAQPAIASQTRIGISFQDKDGHYCRTFDTDAPSPLAGVACREDGSWHIAVLTALAGEPGAGAAFQLAGSTMPEAVRGAVRGMIFGAPLDAAGEYRARARHWLKP